MSFPCGFCMEKLMNRICVNCGTPFQPRPQVPNQAYCSSPKCQRARKLRWQQDKLRSDPLYRESQRDAQRAWLSRHPGYWVTYRARQSKKKEGNGISVVPCLRRGGTKLDVSSLPSGLYQLRQVTDSPSAPPSGWLVELIPVCLDCTCKKDACKEKT